MALTAGTLPSNTVYPATVQALLTLLAQYLSSPTSGQMIYVSTTTPSAPTEGSAWLNPSSLVFQIYATVAPAITPAWTPLQIPTGAVGTSQIAAGAVGIGQLSAPVVAILDSLAASSGTTVAALEEPGGGSYRANLFVMVDGTARATGANGGNAKNGVGARSGADNSYLPKRCGFSPPLAGDSVAKIYTRPAATYVLTTAGQVYVSGLATNSQLGLGNTTTQPVFTLIPATSFGSSPVTKLAIGMGPGNFYSCYALNQAGALYAWGANTHGQLGMGTVGSPDTTNRTTPTIVSSLVGIKKNDTVTNDPITDIVVAGIGATSTTVNASAYVITTEGHAYSCGRNNYGQLGDAGGLTADRSYFKLVPGLTDYATLPLQPTIVKQIAVAGGTSAYSSVAFLCSNVGTGGTIGVVRTAGSGTVGQLGNNTGASNSTVQNVVTDGIGTILGATDPVLKLRGFGQNFFALTTALNAWGWGLNASGQMGTNDLANKIYAVQLSPTNVTGLTVGGDDGDASVCIQSTTAGAVTLWCAGANANGELGIGTVGATQKTFAQVLVDSTAITSVRFTANFDAVANTSNLLILLSNGQVLACGYDTAGLGQLGVDASPAAISVPSFVLFG